MDFVSNVIDLKSAAKAVNAINPTSSQDYATKIYVDTPVIQTITGTTATLTPNADTDIILSTTTVAVAVTIPAARVKPIIIKHMGTQDMTVTMIGGGTIDLNPNVQLRGGKKNAVGLFFTGGNGYIW